MAKTQVIVVMAAAALALAACMPAPVPASAPSPSAPPVQATSPGGFHCLIASGCGDSPAQSEAPMPAAAAQPPAASPSAVTMPYSSPAPAITPAAPPVPKPAAPTQSPPRPVPSAADPQQPQCPTGQVDFSFTSLTATVDQETYSDQVTINGTVANSTPQPVAITPLRVYPLGSVQVDLSAWAVYGTQTTPAPVVIAPGQAVAFKVREGVANSYYATINSWVFNPGFTQAAFADAPYAGVCSVQASWGQPVENH